MSMRRIKNLRNIEVAKVWGNLRFDDIQNECISHENHEGTFRVYSDGTVYSYKLLIGEIKNNERIVYDYTSPGERFYSNTTSRHVGLLKKWASRSI